MDLSKKLLINPPTPVERVAVRNFGLASESLFKAEGFWDCYFWACCARCPKPSIFPVFLRLSVSRGRGVDAQDLHPQHHQDYLGCHEFLFFADTSGVLLFQAMLELACWGLGGAKCSDALRNC